MDNGFHSEGHLLRQFAAGEQPTFEALFNEWYANLVFFVQRFSLSREEAEDVVAESFTKLWMARGGFDAVNKIRSFLYVTSRNAAVDLLRRKNREAMHLPLDGLDPAHPVPDGNLESIHAEVIGAVFREIERLPAKCRQVMLLTYKEGLSTQQIAERLNISISNVTSQRSRAIALLKIALRNQFLVLVLLDQLFGDH